LKILPFIILAVLISACSAFEQRSKEREEAAIYSFLLNEDPESYLGGSTVLMVLNETDLGADAADEVILQRAPSLHEETLADWRAANQKSQAINPKLSLNRPYKMIDAAEMKLGISENRDWENPYTVTIFSKVGFNNRLDQALVYVEHNCGSECATGNLYFLVRNDNAWKIETIVLGWVS